MRSHQKIRGRGWAPRRTLEVGGTPGGDGVSDAWPGHFQGMGANTVAG